MSKHLMKFVKLIFTALVVVLVSVNSYSQRNFSKEADEAYKVSSYSEAIDLYKVAFSKAKKNRVEKARIIYQVANCYRMKNEYKQAELWFQKAINARHLDPYAKLYLADAKKYNGKYEEALVWYQKFVKNLPNSQDGKNGIESCQLAMEWIDTPSNYNVEISNAF